MAAADSRGARQFVFLCGLFLRRNTRRKTMRHAIVTLLLVGGFVAISSIEASAVVCARGVYRAGCVRTVGTTGAGAVVVRRPVVVAPRARVGVRRAVYR
jgi:hypothetical protein